MSLNRRELLGRTAAFGAATLMPTVTLAADKIKLGSILDTSGIFDAYGKPMDQATRLAVSCSKQASTMESEMVSQTLSG